MASAEVLSDTPLESKQPKSGWHYYLLEHRETFAKLAWYLVADAVLVDCVLTRAVARLETTPFDPSDALVTNNQARRALISEAITVLNQQQRCVATSRSRNGPTTIGDLTDFRRLALQKRRSRRSLPEEPHRNNAMFSAPKITLPTKVSGIRIPDTPLASAATEFVSGITPLWLMHHLLRSYVFAELLGRRGKMKYDQELLYLGAIMHDLGLTEEFARAQRFELDGADAAKWFLLRQGLPKARIYRVWSAIRLHTSSGIYDRMRPEIALLGLGVLADVTGAGIEQLPSLKVREVLETWPRHGFRDAFPKRVAEIVGRKPQTAIGSFAADVLRQRGIAVPTVCEVMAAAPF